MLDVDVEKILPITEVRDSLNKIIDAVADSEDLYVVTKNGKPAAIIVGVHHLEKLTGIDHKLIIPDDAEEDNNKTAQDIKITTAPDDSDAASTATPDTSTSDAITSPTSANTEKPADNAVSSAPIVDANPTPANTTAMPEIKVTTAMDDGIDDLFAPETPSQSLPPQSPTSQMATPTPTTNTTMATPVDLPTAPTPDMSSPTNAMPASQPAVTIPQPDNTPATQPLTPPTTNQI